MMHFQLIPVLDLMEQLYRMPLTVDRFKEYLATLQEDSGDDLQLPLMGYNPMGKGHVMEKVMKLQSLGAENIIRKTIQQLNTGGEELHKTYRVVLNLADDVGGAWTNKAVVDFNNRFKMKALITRKFCTPYFWTSEQLSSSLIRERTLENIYRSIYYVEHGDPQTLEDHLRQEIYVAKHSGSKSAHPFIKDTTQCSQFYQKNKLSDNYSLLFNFFYGDGASEILNYPTFGIGPVNGIEFAQYCAQENSSPAPST